MAEATKMKDLQEARKRLETENLKRDGMEKKMQEQIQNLGAKHWNRGERRSGQ